MKKKILFAALLVASVMPAAAQETYEIANLSGSDLTGTARYVGMGGAMEALGADLSTMSTNPAGIGLFRSSQFRGTFSLVSQPEVESFANTDKTHVSFDQAGFVWSSNTSGKTQSFLNIGVNYSKHRNFNQILRVVDRLDGASQSKLTYNKFRQGCIESSSDLTYSQEDALYHESLYDTNLILDNGEFNTDAYAFDGEDYAFNRGAKGYMAEFNFNVSGNINNRVYLGGSIGVYSIDYNCRTLYDENIRSNELGLNTTTLEDNRQIDGTGVDLKLGVIFRPVEYSPFRVGLYVHTPTFFNIKTRNNTTLALNDQIYDYGRRDGSNEYEFRTPWKFGVSLGHTIGTQVALGATYEYADYSATDARIKTGGSGHYGDYSDPDTDMNSHIQQTLKGVSTLKLGAEFRPDPSIAVRLGYNYVSPMYKKDAYRGVDVWSFGNYDSSVTDYVNWDDTHRITAGVGFTLEKFTIDLAYQFSTQKGQFLPFAGNEENLPNLPFDVEVKNDRHQAMLTLGYNF